jgi:hypothetical protein
MPAAPALITNRAAVDAELGRRDPAWWVSYQLGDHVWSKQREILESVRDNRRTAVQSCHSSGKSWVAARIVAWWLSCHPPGEARVVTSAPTGDQVKAILWHEIGRAHALGKLPGRLNQTEWWMEFANGREEMVGIGRKPAEHNPDAFQGIHERYVLVVLDEACGIPVGLWSAADGLLSNDDCRLLSIGNPTDPVSEFAAECKPGSGANVIRIAASDTPNFTGEEVPEAVRQRLVGRTWVEEKRHRWGEDNPLYIAKVEALFPETTADGLIPLSWVRAAQERELVPSLPVELGVDVGGGGDRSVIVVRSGPVARVDPRWRTKNPDTMQTCGNVLAALRETGATAAKIDEIGIGRGVVDRAKEQGAAAVGVNVGQAASDPEAFVNLRAEIWWNLRERFQDGLIDIDPADDDLAAQLVDVRFKRTSTGKIQIESKDEMKRRGKSSPDDADGLALAFYVPPEQSPKRAAGVWGSRRRKR